MKSSHSAKPESPAESSVGLSPALSPRRAKQRRVIQTAATRLVAANGIAAVSVEQILEEAGVSRRTFYGYFSNKYKLIASVVNPALADGTVLLKKVLRKPAAEAVPGIVDCYCELWLCHSEALSLISALDRDVMPYLHDSHISFGEALKKLLGKAERAKLLRNHSGDMSFKVITRTAVPLLKLYGDQPEGLDTFRSSMLALLLKDNA